MAATRRTGGTPPSKAVPTPPPPDDSAPANGFFHGVRRWWGGKPFHETDDEYWDDAEYDDEDEDEGEDQDQGQDEDEDEDEDRDEELDAEQEVAEDGKVDDEPELKPILRRPPPRKSVQRPRASTTPVKRPPSSMSPTATRRASKARTQHEHTSVEPPILQTAEEDRAGVPARYDDGVAWLVNGFRRERLGSVLGLIFGWTGVWLALWGAVIGMVAGIFLAFGVITAPSVSSQLFNFGVGQGITALSVITGGVFGIAGGFLAVLKFLFVDRPVQAIVSVVTGVILSVLIVVCTAAFERASLRMRGYRRLSNDEVRRIAPLVKDVADAMNLPALPRFAMEDSVLPNAWSHMRTIVITKGMLQTLDDNELRAILAHELTHWNSGDAVASHFVWAAAFPAILVYNIGTWLASKWPLRSGEIGGPSRTIMAAIGWFIAWPAALLIRFVLIPVTAQAQRRCEYEADQGAARIGLSAELISALRKISVFESGRTGWEIAMAATHPPTELRIEALQTERPDDWEYQEEELHGPTWAEFRRIFGGLRYVARADNRDGRGG